MLFTSRATMASSTSASSKETDVSYPSRLTNLTHLASGLTLAISASLAVLTPLHLTALTLHPATQRKSLTIFHLLEGPEFLIAE